MEMVCLLSAIVLLNIALNQAGACSPPTDLKARYDNNTESIKVSWNPSILNSADTVIEYVIYVALNSKSSAFKRTTPNYELQNPILASKYIFDVRTYCTKLNTYSEPVRLIFGYIGSAIFACIGQKVANFRWPIKTDTSTKIINVSNRIAQLFSIVGEDTLISYDNTYKGRVNYTGNFSRTTMSFTLSDVTKADAGYYKISDPSGSLMMANGGQILVVLDKPSKPIITFGQPVVGKTFTMTCNSQHTSLPVYYTPELQYAWCLNGSIQMNDTILQGRFRSHGNTLTLTNVYKDDKGNRFTCKASDKILSSEESDSYSLDPLSRPKVPRHFKVQEVYSKMVNLSWISEFNGGMTQMFVIEYSEKGDNSILDLINVTDKGFGKKIEAAIWSLKANTSYTFTLYSCNDLGSSDISKELEIRTKGAEQTEQAKPTNNLNTVTISVLTASAVIFIAVIVIVVVILQIQRRKKIRRDLQMVDTVEYQNSSRIKELAEKRPYDGLKPEDPNQATESPYSANFKMKPGLKKRKVAATDKRKYDEVVADMVQGKGRKRKISDKTYLNTVMGKVTKGKKSDEMYVNTAMCKVPKLKIPDDMSKDENADTVRHKVRKEKICDKMYMNTAMTNVTKGKSPVEMYANTAVDKISDDMYENIT